MVGMAFAETRRLQDFNSPGSLATGKVRGKPSASMWTREQCMGVRSTVGLHGCLIGVIKGAAVVSHCLCCGSSHVIRLNI